MKEHLRCLADQGFHASTIKDWPLTFRSLSPWALTHIVALSLPHVLVHANNYLARNISPRQEPCVLYLVNHYIGLLFASRRSVSHMEYFRKEKGPMHQAKSPRALDDGNL